MTIETLDDGRIIVEAADIVAMNYRDFTKFSFTNTVSEAVSMPVETHRVVNFNPQNIPYVDIEVTRTDKDTFWTKSYRMDDMYFMTKKDDASI